MDRRVNRTIRLLREALMSLMMEKGYEAISVQDIIDRADVGRSTFYAHFYDKEQLLLSNLGELRNQLENYEAMQKSEHRGTPFRFRFSCGMLQHVKQNVKLYRATVGKNSRTIVLFHFKEMAKEMVNAELSDRYLFQSLPKPIIIQYVVETFITLLQWWVEQDPAHTAEEIDEQFHRLVFTGIHGVLQALDTDS